MYHGSMFDSISHVLKIHVQEDLFKLCYIVDNSSTVLCLQQEKDIDGRYFLATKVISLLHDTSSILPNIPHLQITRYDLPAGPAALSAAFVAL